MDTEIVEVWKKWEGQTVDQVFLLHRYLGGSENSAVFLTELNERRAALKLVAVDPPTADARLSRWQSAARLSHPHLVRLYRSGRCQLEGTDFLYAVMEYAEEDLSQVLPQRPLTSTEALEMLRPALDALDYLHREGFVHGDLKPSNIMAVDDRLKLSTDSLIPIGEKAAASKGVYDAPDETVSPKSDVWSLGVALVQVLTQRLPVWNDKASNAAVLPGGLLEPFAGIARLCLERSPQERPSVAEITRRLDNPSDGQTPQRSLRMIYLGVIAAVVLIGIVIFALRSGSAPVETKAAVTPPAAAEPKPIPKETQIPPPPPKAQAPAGAGQDLPDEVLEQPVPEIAQSILNTIHGRIRINVRVTVDPSGKVSEATIEPPGGSKYLSERTLRSARQFKFRPQDGKQEWILRFLFVKTGTTVAARRLSP